ncbi:hypothetical protein ABES08_19985 [Peribacillus simplex]|uniref:hypothetical protein n=1 Tax=Peribacillus simplex TaxID=1478 RepID=UPI003D29EDA8
MCIDYRLCLIFISFHFKKNKKAVASFQKKLQEEHPIDPVPTIMRAHAVPKDYKGREDEFVDHLINDMLPIFSEEKLAEFSDGFCEKGVFTPEQSEGILKAGKKYGLILKFMLMK